jgi:hypothetical protein
MSLILFLTIAMIAGLFVAARTRLRGPDPMGPGRTLPLRVRRLYAGHRDARF